MNTGYLAIEQSGPLCGEVELSGAKNAVLVIMASLILTKGISYLRNVPHLSDVIDMMQVLEALGAEVFFSEQNHVLKIDTSQVNSWYVSEAMMKRTRASILVMGALLARFGKADVGMPGGDAIGMRPIDYHIKSFLKMGVCIEEHTEYISATVKQLQSARIVLEYPSVGATENSILAATAAHGKTTIINAALEPEVLDLINALIQMGAVITINAPATISIEGGRTLKPIDHTIMVDRLETGSLLLAAAITGGSLYLPTAQVNILDVFLSKLEEMGHQIEVGPHDKGIRLIATTTPRAVSFKTGPYPSFPTDLQAPMMVAQCIAQGKSVIEETVFENRLLHVPELHKMGASIYAERTKAVVQGVQHFKGTSVVATDIRASCALVLAGLVAQGYTYVHGLIHWRRGYDKLEQKLIHLGATISIINESPILNQSTHNREQII